jgi:hypothetical protein
MADSFFSTVVDSSVRFIQFYKQTKPRLQLQAMLTRKVNGELLVISSVKFRHLRTIQDCILGMRNPQFSERFDFGYESKKSEFCILRQHT